MLEAISIDCSIKIITDPSRLPLHEDDIARIIAEALNREYPRGDDPTKVVQISIGGEEIAWQDASADAYE